MGAVGTSGKRISSDNELTADEVVKTNDAGVSALVVTTHTQFRNTLCPTACEAQAQVQREVRTQSRGTVEYKRIGQRNRGRVQLRLSTRHRRAETN